MTRKNTWGRFAVAVVLSLPLTACKDTKTLQENEQLKAHVAEDFRRENGHLQNDLEAMTADRDELKKENDKASGAAQGPKNEKESCGSKSIITAKLVHRFQGPPRSWSASTGFWVLP